MIKKTAKSTKGKRRKDQYCKNIMIIGEITSKLSKDIFASLLDDIEISKVDELNLFINTPGGSLHDCFGILDVIEYQKNSIGYTVNSFGIGEVVSAGFFLFLVGDNRILFPRCRVYVHEHWSEDDGSEYHEKKKDIKEDDKLNKMYVKYTSERLGISIQRVRRLIRSARWLSDNDINKYNIITGAI